MSVQLLFALTMGGLIAPETGSAQEMRWSELSGLGLNTVYVFDDQGIETVGVVRQATTDSLVISIGGGQDRVFRAGQVRRIDRRGDSVKNGALIGGGVGLMVGVLMLSTCSEYVVEGCGETVAAYTAIGTLFYGLLGAGIDALIVGRSTVYRGPAATAGVPWRAVVQPSADGLRLGLRLGFK